MKFKSYYWVLVLVGLFMGLILTLQFRVAVGKQLSPNSYLDRSIAIAKEVEEARASRDQLQARVDELRSSLDVELSGLDEELSGLNKEWYLARQQAGMTEMEGPGVEVILNDNSKVRQPEEDYGGYLVHDYQVRSVLNELKAAGAEAISINGQRIISTTEVRCIGPTILINNQRLSPPMVISALGDSDTLYNSLKMTGGVVYVLQTESNIQVAVKKNNKVFIPAYTGVLIFDYAKPSK